MVGDTLLHLLKTLAIGETRIEELRKTLAEDLHFSPRAAFEDLDIYKLGYLTTFSFMELADEKNIETNDEDLRLLIRQYSTEGNGRMSLEDFTRFILPVTSDSFNDSAWTIFTKSQKSLVISLIESELSLQVELENIKQRLHSSPGYSVHRCFKAIDMNDQGLIFENTIVKFANKRNTTFNREDINAIFRRIQTKNTNYIDFNDFMDFILPSRSQKTFN